MALAILLAIMLVSLRKSLWMTARILPPLVLGDSGPLTPKTVSSCNSVLNDSEVGIGDRNYILRQIDYQYQHLNWSRINSDGSTFEFTSYHNKFDIFDQQDALTFYQALNFFPEGPLKESLAQLPDKLIIEPFHKAISERWDSEFRATFDHRHNVRAAYGAALRRDKVKSNKLFDMSDLSAENTSRGLCPF